jgi:hypothetical protein
MLGERIERCLYDMPKTLICARCTQQRGELPRQVNLALEVLRYQPQLAQEPGVPTKDRL